MRAHEPGRLDRAVHLLDVQGYLALCLTGTLATSWTAADPSGLYDIAGKAWSADVLGRLGLGVERMAPAHPPGTVLGHLHTAAAAETGLPDGLPVIAAGGDGQCAGLGVNAMRAGDLLPEPRDRDHHRRMVRGPPHGPALAHDDLPHGEGLLPRRGDARGHVLRRLAGPDPAGRRGPRNVRRACGGGGGAPPRQRGRDRQPLPLRLHEPALGDARQGRVLRPRRVARARASLPRDARGVDGRDRPHHRRDAGRGRGDRPHRGGRRRARSPGSGGGCSRMRRASR